MTPSNVSGITVPVPSDQDYTAPVNTKSRIADKFRRLAEVEVIGHDGQPHAVSAPAAAPVAGSIPAGQPPSMVDALLHAATACNADPAALVDSEAFMVSIGAISPADSAGLQDAVLVAMHANPSIAIQPVTPGMRVNPAQGSSGNGFQPKAPRSTLERLHEQAAKQMGQPIPPGSVV